MANHKEPVRPVAAPQQASGKLIIATKDEIGKFGGQPEVKAEPIRSDDKKLINELRELTPNFLKVLSGYSDEELDRLGNDRGVAGVFEKLMEEALFGDTLVQLKQTMKENRHSPLSNEVEDYFDDVKARSLLRNGGMHFQVMRDDRLGENMDIAFAMFDLPDSKLDLPKEESKIDAFQRCLATSGYETAGNLLMRTESEYLKLLVYYCKLKSFEDLNTLFQKYDEKKDEFAEFKPYHRQDILSFVCELKPGNLETLFRELNVSSLKDYFSLLFDAPFMTMFLQEPNFDKAMAIAKLGKINCVESFVKLFSDENSRNLVKNLKNAKKGNFDILIDVADIESLEELEILCSNPVISSNIGEVDYGRLKGLLAKLIDDKTELKSCMYEVISRTYNKQIHENIEKLASAITSASAPKGLKRMVLDACLDRLCRKPQ